MDDAELDPDGLYHLATVAEWDAHRLAGAIEPASLEAEGFVHCSWGRQVMATLARHFDGVTDVLALRLDTNQIGSRMVEEDSYGSGESFPHIYDPIPAAVVVDVIALTGEILS